MKRVQSKKVMGLRLISILFLALVQVGCGQLTPGTGEGFSEKYEYEYTLLREAIFTQFYDVFRPSSQDLAWDLKMHDGGNYKDNRGIVPMAEGVPGTNRHDICRSEGDPNCGGIAFGEELLAHPEVRTAIEDWLSHFCDRFPKEGSKKVFLYYSRPDQQSKVNTLRRFMGCEGATIEVGNIHFYVVRNFDSVFTHDDKHVGAVLKQSVISEHIFKLNQ